MTTIYWYTSDTSDITVYWFADGSDADPVIVTAWEDGKEKEVSTWDSCPGSSYSLYGGQGAVGCLVQNTQYDIILTDKDGNPISSLYPVSPLAILRTSKYRDQIGDGGYPAHTLPNSRATIFAGRFSGKPKDVYQYNPPNVSLSFVGRLAIADLLINLSWGLECHLSIARRGPVDRPVDPPIFDLLVPEINLNRNSISHYTRQGTSGGWKRVDTLVLPDQTQIPDTAVSHIQSFRAPEHLDALAWLQPESTLVAFEYEPSTGVHQSITVTTDKGPVTQVNGKPALIQTNQRLFHLLVPRFFDGMQQIVHLVLDNRTIQNSWKQVAILQVPAKSSVVSIAFVQADNRGSLKAVVRIRPLSQGPDFLQAYQSDPNFHWQGPFPVSVVNLGETLAVQPGDTVTNVVGSPGLVQSIFGDQEQLDLVVPIINPSTGDITLTQFTQPAGIDTSINQPWTVAASLQPLNDDPHTQVVSASIIQDIRRDLQAIAHVTTPTGENLFAFYIFNPQTGWSRPSVVTTVDGNPIIVGQLEIVT